MGPSVVTTATGTSLMNGLPSPDLSGVSELVNHATSSVRPPPPHHPPSPPIPHHNITNGTLPCANVPSNIYYSSLRLVFFAPIVRNLCALSAQAKGVIPQRVNSLHQRLHWPRCFIAIVTRATRTRDGARGCWLAGPGGSGGSRLGSALLASSRRSRGCAGGPMLLLRSVLAIVFVSAWSPARCKASHCQSNRSLSAETMLPYFLLQLVD